MEKNFKTYIALISNRRNTDERYFIKSSRLQNEHILVLIIESSMSTSMKDI